MDPKATSVAPRRSWPAWWHAAAAVAWVALSMSCGSSPTTPSGGGSGGGGGCITNCGGSGGGGGSTSGVLVGAGDIAACDPTISAGLVATAKQIDGISGTVFTAGDNAYFHGTEAEYRDCYNPYWGRFKSRTKPVPGNHEYETAGASAYYNYFPDAAGPEGLGYYSYTVGPWLVLALNSEIPSGPNSPQVFWLRQEILNNPHACTMAIWHRPLFSSGPNGNTTAMQDLWRVLYELKVDVVVNGHDHIYERFAPQMPDGLPDPTNGIQEFVVGTGGASLTDPVTAKPNSQVRIKSWGVLQFTLSDGAYSWAFIPVDSSGSSDSGTGRCH